MSHKMKSNHILDKYNYFSSKDNNIDHTLFFDENKLSPATLLQNSVFALKMIDGIRDCVILAILL